MYIDKEMFSIPTGILMQLTELSSVFVPNTDAQPPTIVGCSDGCSGGCSGSCSGSCAGSCGGTCSGSCQGSN